MEKFRLILRKIQDCIDMQNGATESQLKTIWNDLSNAITEQELKPIKNMRKVLYKKWISPIWPEGANSVNCQTTHMPKEGTNCWEKEFCNEGVFHQWASVFIEFETGPGNYTIGLIELQDGTIIEVLPTNIKFIQ